MIWNILQEYAHQRCRVIRCCVLKRNGPVALRKQNGAQKPKVQSSFTAKLLCNNNILGCICLVLYKYDIWFVWRDRWMVWLGRVEAWRAEEVNHWNYEKQEMKLLLDIAAIPKHADDNIPLARSAGQTYSQWHHRVSSHFMKSRGLDCFFALSVVYGTSDGMKAISLPAKFDIGKVFWY